MTAPRTLSELFEQSRNQQRAALIGYLPAGFPSRDGAVAALRAMVEGGVDVIEVGLPYTDPLLDGPTIQRAVDIALSNHTATPDVIETVRQVAETGAPTLVMTYWNPVERYGVGRFAADLAKAGGVGLITADITPEEATDWIDASKVEALDRVFLVAPSSTDERIALTTRASSGFVYAAAVMGVTGARSKVGSAARALVGRARQHTSLPICVGLGVSTGEQATEIASFADGVIVGSAFVKAMLEAPDEHSGIERVRGLASQLRSGVEAATYEPKA